MAARPLASRRGGVRTVLGLPASALATMVGVVLVINAHVYGWPGVAAGLLLAAAGVALGVHCFRFSRADSSAVPHPAATGCPESGEIRE